MESSSAFWNWNGRYVGYRVSDSLYSNDGHQIGHFAEGDEVYGDNGSYIGEVRSGNRLIANSSKKKWTRSSFIPQLLRNNLPGRPDVTPKDMLVGYEDFPAPRSVAP